MDYNCEGLPPNLPDYGLFVTDFSDEETEESIRNFFSKFGDPFKIMFRKRDSADVFFHTKNEMIDALRAHGKQLNGKYIHIYISKVFLNKYHLPLPDYFIRNTKQDNQPSSRTNAQSSTSHASTPSFWYQSLNKTYQNPSQSNYLSPQPVYPGSNPFPVFQSINQPNFHFENSQTLENFSEFHYAYRGSTEVIIIPDYLHPMVGVLF